MSGITEQMVLDWLQFDGVKFDVHAMSDGSIKIEFINVEGWKNELRMSEFVHYLNQKVSSEQSAEQRELARLSARLEELEALLPKTMEQKSPPPEEAPPPALGVHVKDKVGVHDVFGDNIGTFNAFGLMVIDEEGVLKSYKPVFFRADKAHMAFRKGQKILVEVK